VPERVAGPVTIKKLTAKPDEDEALTLNAASPYVLSARALKVIVCAAFAIVSVPATIAEIEPTELAPPQIIDLDEWFILPADTEPTAEPEPRIVDQAREIEKAEAAFTLPAFYFTRSSEPVRAVEEIQLALDFG